MDDNYTAVLAQRLAKMRETAHLAAAFHKGLLEEGVEATDAVQITGLYALMINHESDEEEGDRDD
jgi:hypothetical protein